MIKNYLKIAIKVLFRRKLYTFITLTGISITLMIVMVATSFWHHMQAYEKPCSNFDRVSTMLVLRLDRYNKEGEKVGNNTTPPSYHFVKTYLKTLKTPEKVAAVSSIPLFIDYYANNKKSEFTIRYNDSEFWEICDFDFIYGRGFNKQEFDNKEKLIVINRRTADVVFPGVNPIGKSMEIYSEKFKVVGVVENVDVSRLKVYSDVYIPISTNRMFDEKSLNSGFPCATLIMTPKADDYEKVRKEIADMLPKVENITRFHSIKLSGNTEKGLLTIMAVTFATSEQKIRNIINITIALIVLFFLLLPATNLVNINISRIYERSSEIGVRKSFGAPSSSIAVQFIVENVFITILGSLISVLLTLIVISMMNNSGFMANLNLKLYPIALFYSFLVTLLFGLMSGALPAWRMSRLKIAETLKNV